MPAGRPPKPTALHLLSGTYREDRHGKRSAAKVGDPLKRPRNLSAGGKWLWRRAIRPLAAAGVLTSADAPSVYLACEMWALYRIALQAAKRDPLNKDARIAVTSYATSFNAVAARLGMTPADRAKLNIDSTNDELRQLEEKFYGSN